LDFVYKIISFALIIILLGACASHKNRKLNKEISRVLNHPTFRHHFSGIMILDPATGDTLYRKNSDKYFIPGSNTKIFTLFSALKLLPERVPVLKYSFQQDTLYIAGTGDATQLHPFFKDSTAAIFLKGFTNISLCQNLFEDEKYGPGWAWEDYDGYYSPERSSLPLYGNVVTIDNSVFLSITPDYFKDSVITVSFSRNRKLNSNTFFFDPSRRDTLEIPFIADLDLTKRLLEKAVGKRIFTARQMPATGKEILYGMSSDSVYKRMMEESDNFLAEQLLIMASSTLSDTLSSGRVREYVLDTLLTDLKQPPRWVDGSGLSRYNLFTPESIVHVLTKMYREVPRRRLFDMFAVGGVSGTLKDWYPGNPVPYIHAKTGTLGNNHCLSGYLMTSSGKVLIFSFMNNHFRQPATEVKQQIQLVLEWVRDHY
jgi:D-alanyl-D-alanine carboxypeptidase/D-alanyl-D-alanine-endopeptidase (penicillin-binding protein 4)